jgi:hypothetical protein
MNTNGGRKKKQPIESRWILMQSTESGGIALWHATTYVPKVGSYIPPNNEENELLEGSYKVVAVLPRKLNDFIGAMMAMDEVESVSNSSFSGAVEDIAAICIQAGMGRKWLKEVPKIKDHELVVL